MIIQVEVPDYYVDVAHRLGCKDEKAIVRSFLFMWGSDEYWARYIKRVD